MGQDESERRSWDREQERLRKAEYRERKRLERERLNESEEQQIRDFWGFSSSETRSRAERDQAAKRMLKGRPTTTLDSYVKETVEGARLEGVRRGESGGLLQDRLGRAEAYARWRWAGVRDGSVASL